MALGMTLNNNMQPTAFGGCRCGRDPDMTPAAAQFHSLRLFATLISVALDDILWPA